MRKLRFLAASLGVSVFLMAAASLTTTRAAWAAEHEIKMLNRGEAGIMVFEPAFLEVAPGDTVRFRAVDKGHNAASIDGVQIRGYYCARSERGRPNAHAITAGRDRS